MFLTSKKTKKITDLRPLRENDKVRLGDVIEDLATGERVTVTASSYYGFLNGHVASQARQLPDVFDVLRPV